MLSLLVLAIFLGTFVLAGGGTVGDLAATPQDRIDAAASIAALVALTWIGLTLLVGLLRRRSPAAVDADS